MKLAEQNCFFPEPERLGFLHAVINKLGEVPDNVHAFSKLPNVIDLAVCAEKHTCIKAICERTNDSGVLRRITGSIFDFPDTEKSALFLSILEKTRDSEVFRDLAGCISALPKADRANCFNAVLNKTEDAKVLGKLVPRIHQLPDSVTGFYAILSKTTDTKVLDLLSETLKFLPLEQHDAAKEAVQHRLSTISVRIHTDFDFSG